MHPIQQWDRDVGYHLKAIEAAAAMLLDHADQLKVRPIFETKAQAEMIRCAQRLEGALAKLYGALVVYERKETEP
jgi:hypothetical protein